METRYTCLTGFFLISIALPRIIWTLNSTAREIYLEDQSFNTVEARFGTIFFMLCITSFMFMLTFMSYHRYAAIKWPFHTMQESKKRFGVKLFAVWILAFIIATYTSECSKKFLKLNQENFLRYCNYLLLSRMAAL